MRINLRKTFLAVLALSAVVAASLVTPAAARAPEPGEGEGLKFVKNLPTGTGPDAEVVKIGDKWYAFANSREQLKDGGGINVIDVTNPAKAYVAANIPCVGNQGDIQISADKKVLLQGHSASGGPESCLALGMTGFLTVDISNPLKPKPVGFGDSDTAHNLTVHPKKPLVYISEGSLGAVPGNIQIWSFKNPAKPELVNNITNQVGHSPHDISFSKDGKWAVTASVDHFDIYNTTDPENPTLAYKGQCPGCTITHDAKFTPDGKSILIGDEAGGGLAFPCPGGAWYFYDFSTPPVPVLTGVYEPAEFVVARNHSPGMGCTSHVFDVSEDGTKVAISWYQVGTRYLDISSAIGATVGPNRTPTGVIECGWYIPDDGDSWASKFGPGDRWIFSNDIARGFDIFKITAECG